MQWKKVHFETPELSVITTAEYLCAEISVGKIIWMTFFFLKWAKMGFEMAEIINWNADI